MEKWAKCDYYLTQKDSMISLRRCTILVPSSEGGIALRLSICCAVYQGTSIRPELDQFWRTFLLTYLLLNIDKK